MSEQEATSADEQSDQTSVPSAPVDAPPVPSELPEPIVPLAWLIGTWVGVGLGQYPTIEDFRFGQELRFWSDGRPFLYYQSLSWIVDDEGNKVRQALSETGYWRPVEDKLQVLMTYSNGYSELMLGENTVTSIENAVIKGARAELKSDVIVGVEGSKEYTASERMYGLNNEDLFWAFDMAAVGQPMQNHLAAQLKRASYIGDPQHFQTD
ncbi:MAG: FABP family protein [Candidatus Nanopelagicales bacterium]